MACAVVNRERVVMSPGSMVANRAIGRSNIVGQSGTFGNSSAIKRSSTIGHSGAINRSSTIARTVAQLAESLRGEDVEIRKNAKYTSITDSLEPFSQSLAQALAETNQAHFLGMRTPDFNVPRVDGQQDVPYKAFYDEKSEAYRGGSFLSYLSRGPLSKDKYDLVPCGCDEKSGDPDPQVVPQDVWDGNVIADFLEKQGNPGTKDLLRKATAAPSSPEGSKDLVVLLNFVQAGYWGHMMDNGLPRVAIAARAAKRAGYKLHVLIPPEKVVYGWHSLRQVQEMVEQLFGGKLVVPDQSEDQLPAHCQGAGRGDERGDVCRLFFTCGLPSFHEVVRREFHRMAQDALDRHQSLLEFGPEQVSHPPRPGLFLLRGSDAHHRKGDVFSPKLEKELVATGQWDTASELSSWPLMKLGSFVRGHKHLLSVEGSGAYHMVWLRGQRGGRTQPQQGSSLGQAGGRGTVIELEPQGSVDTCRWLWAHCVGLDYKVVLFAPGETDTEAFVRASSAVVGGGPRGGPPGGPPAGGEEETDTEAFARAASSAAAMVGQVAAL
eukprot:CAMPEP_0115227150 /NCGR_PEP_ID=MMETSP0270-20121206/30995_1 /TAXON_ID=71861 /ORGANISM="Scrippsiella trochoidea, Strain CCMP3099" /LENGTH=548 /DNA_ID=CAMNT_0002641589 /DNA_START=30 /DNA_END=1676 /DNA_ORIENTATION=+